MSLSPDECKWSERLTPTRQGMRCGFTGTWVCEWDVLEPCLLYGRLWRRYERVMYACACVGVTRLFRRPHFPSNFDLLRLLSIPQEDSLTAPESGWARLWLCVCVSSFPNELTTFLCFLWTAYSVWISADRKHVQLANNKLSRSCHKLTYIHLTPRRVI